MNELPNADGAYGFSHFWAQGDAVTHSVAVILLVMSILSWTQIVIKGWRAYRRGRAAGGIERFWQASSLPEAIRQIDDKTLYPFAEMARQGARAAEHFDERSGKTLGGSTSREEFITRALRQSIVRSTARMESGLTLLASIGSIAPFVGLLGTVWGIYHALLTIAAAGAATIDKVSGPVGEALIMTAAGLFVAIPAVFAYNLFVRCNRVEQAELDGFAHDLHAYLTTGMRVNAQKSTKAVMRVIDGGQG